jgi:RND family efflux transporter MFP subunit
VEQRRKTSGRASDTGQTTHRLPGWIQLALFAFLLGTAGALWIGRDHVSALVANVMGAEQAGKSKKKNAKGVPVVVARAGELSDDVAVGAIGTGRARRSVMLFPEAAGEVQQLLVVAGERVNHGQSLMLLDARAARLAVKVAKTRLIAAERLLARAEQLREKNITSQVNVDDAHNVVERAKLELEQAEEALADRELRAPFDGVVGIPKVERGNRVTTTTDILTLDDRSHLIVEFEIPELYLTRLDRGLKISAQSPSYPERTFEGVIEHIDSRIDPTSRTVTVRANIPNSDDLLRPGMSFVVDLTIPGPKYPTVHELALQWRKGVSYVWRVRDGKAERVEVSSVKRLNSTILVKGDIAKGDLVVIEGVHRLRPGRAVSFAEPEQVPSS